MKCILGKKLGMSQLFTDEGATIPVTFIQVGPCRVVDIKTPERDGYCAIELGYEETAKKLAKAQRGHLKGLASFRYLREFRFVEIPAGIKRGSVIGADAFSVGERVKVSGTMKGRGFQGGVKRHGFSGGQRSHGHRHVLRTIGSIGSSYPQKVWKGKRMPGQYGNTKVSVRNLTVVAVDAKENIIALHGAVPGARGGLIRIEGASRNHGKKKE